MRGQINKGNWLPFYRRIEHQNRFLNHCGHCKWGLLTPRTHLLPWQVIVDGITADFSWYVVNLCDEETQIPLTSVLISRECTETQTILTYPGTRIVDEIFNDLECGFHYIVLTVDGVSYYSEVMKLDEVCGKEETVLTLSTCAENAPSGYDFTFDEEDDLLFPVLSETIEVRDDTSGLWFPVGTDSVVHLEPTGDLDEVINVRRTVLTKCGEYTKTYQVTYDAGDPCGTAIMLEQ